MEFHSVNLSNFLKNVVSELKSVQGYSAYRSHPKWKEIESGMQKILSQFELYRPFQNSASRNEPKLDDQNHASTGLQVCAWNIERGLALEGIQKTLREHPEISRSEILLLTEVDLGMARSGNRNIAKDLSESLGFEGVWAPAYLNLDKGNGAENHVPEENAWGFQGHAVLSRYPIVDVKLITLPNAKDHLKGNERQIGREVAIVASIQTPYGLVKAIPIHLAAHSSRKHRYQQMKVIVDQLENETVPVILGGDWNTTTYNAHNARRAILGFWRRVAMGVRHTMRTHYPYPEKYFEKPLFDMLEDKGFSISSFNILGGCTLHYDFHDPFVRKGLEDWLPQWCFAYVDWALKPFDGKCSFKLDWFAGKNCTGLHSTIVRELPKGQQRYSDHDPIITKVLPKASSSTLGVQP